MKNIICSKLKELERIHSIKILYACEAGSRAWGLDSKNSDYDVRFIYVHPPSYYLSIDPVGIGKKKDVLNLTIDNFLDIHGFEFTKALRLFRKSNPNLLEWLHSEVIYFQHDDTVSSMKKLEPSIFQAKSCILHYVSMAKRNFGWLKEKSEKDVKRYLNVIRPILISKWILEYRSFPPLQIGTIIKDMVKSGPEREEILFLVHAKKEQKRSIPSSTDLLDQFIKNEINSLDESVQKIETKSIQAITEKLDVLFRDTLNKNWLQHFS